jgi:hypothetical protein
MWYCISLVEIETISSHKLLGLQIQDDLKWNEHVDIITKKAARRWYIVRTLKRNGVPEDIFNKLKLNCLKNIKRISTFRAPSSGVTVTPDEGPSLETSKFSLYFSGSCTPTNESLFILLALPTLAQIVQDYYKKLIFHASNFVGDVLLLADVIE